MMWLKIGMQSVYTILLPFYNTYKYLFTQKICKYYQLVFEDYDVTCFNFLYYFWHLVIFLNEYDLLL